MIRDSESKALVETDNDKRNKYKIEKKKLEEIESLKKDIQYLKYELISLREQFNQLTEVQ